MRLLRPDAVSQFGIQIGVPQFIFVIPRKRHHADTLLIKLPQALRPSAAYAAFLHGKHSGHFSVRQIFLYIRIGIHRCDNVLIFLKFFFVERPQLLYFLPGILRFSQIHKQGKILQHIAALLHLPKVHMTGVLPKTRLRICRSCPLGLSACRCFCGDFCDRCLFSSLLK